MDANYKTSSFSERYYCVGSIENSFSNYILLLKTVQPSLAPPAHPPAPHPVPGPAAI
ncbi:hypothetical protein [Methanobacterium aggregans]|uniref:hypothetical protein n=1 Tax=Methanobacterium aggregans TaxID=1615586 RepID=UPI001AE5F3AD|nr:hypothetical protein [Methanobacterium aggregans]MBP2045031.1 hypothetical protein [Methanobacterium aggregans]